MNINYIFRVSVILGCTIVSTLASQRNQDQIYYKPPQIVDNIPAIGESELILVGPFMVSEGEVAVVEKFHKYKRIAKPGLHSSAPFVSRITRVSLKTIMIDTVPQEVFTLDKQKLVVDGSFFYRVTDPYNALYHVQNLEESLKFQFYQVVMTQIGQMDSEKALSLDKNFFSKQVLGVLNDLVKGAPQKDIIEKKEDQPKKLSGLLMEEDHISMEELHIDNKKSVVDQSILGSNDKDWGIVFTKVAITNIAYPKSIMEAMNKKREIEYNRQMEQIQSQTNFEKSQKENERLALELKSRTEMELQTKLEKSKKENEIFIFETKSKTETENQKRLMEAQGKLNQIKMETEGKLIQIEAENKSRLLEAENYAKSLKIRTEAEMEQKELQAQHYQKHPHMLELEKGKILSKAFEEIGKSSSSKLIFQNKEDPGSLYSQLFALGTLPSPKN